MITRRSLLGLIGGVAIAPQVLSKVVSEPTKRKVISNNDHIILRVHNNHPNGLYEWGQYVDETLIAGRLRENLNQLVFELNDTHTRNRAVHLCWDVLDKMTNSPFNGKRSIRNYQIVCNTNNNPPHRIDENKLVVDVYTTII